eukprot:154094_1
MNINENVNYWMIIGKKRKKKRSDEWHKKHPIDHTEIDLDEIDFEIECAEWKLAPKPPPPPKPTALATTTAAFASAGFDPNTGLSTTINNAPLTGFSNLEENIQSVLMSSQPIESEQEESEEEKDIILPDQDDINKNKNKNKNKKDDKKEKEDQDSDDDDIGPAPEPMDVTDKVKGMVSNGQLNI